METWVFVDTCVWANFFARPASPEKRTVDRLLDEDRVAIIGPVLAEVLVGFRRDDQANWVASRLRMTHRVDVEWDDWREAARLGRFAASKVHRVPLTDLSLAAVALRLNAFVCTIDPHFDLVEGLKRYSPTEV